MRRAPVGQLQPAPVRMAGRGLPGSQASTQVPEYLRRCTRECPSSSRGRPGPCPRWPRRRRRARRRCARPPARRTTCRSRSRPRPAPAGRVQEQVVRQEQVARQEQAARQVPASPRSRARRLLRPPRLWRAPGQARAPARDSGSGAAAAGSAPSGAISASFAPTSTVSPSWTRILVTTPVPGLGTSVSTLSVEISSSGWSASIVSPSAFSHLTTVPSETETPICGMTTSMIVPVAISRRPARAALLRRSRPAG